MNIVGFFWGSYYRCFISFFIARLRLLVIEKSDQSGQSKYFLSKAETPA